VNNDRLLFYRRDAITFANEITGTGMIRNFGTAVTLTGTNSFTGGLLLDNGQINFATDANLGDISGIVRLYSGTLHNTASLITARQIILGGGYGTLELGNGFLTLTTSLTGDGGLRKTQGNILTLTGAQTYLGGTLVEGGMLKIESGSLATPSVDLAAGTVLNFNNGGGMSGSITGSGTFTRTGAGATIYTGDASHTGGTVVDSGTLQIGVGGTTGSIAGAITNNGTLAFNRGDSSDFGGAITGTGGVLVSGAGRSISPVAIPMAGPPRSAAARFSSGLARRGLLAPAAYSITDGSPLAATMILLSQTRSAEQASSNRTVPPR